MLRKTHIHKQDIFSSHSAEKRRNTFPIDCPALFLQWCTESPSSVRKVVLMFSRLIRLTKPSINKSIIGKHASTFNFGFLEGIVSLAATSKSVGQLLHCFFHMFITVSKQLLKHFCCALNSVSSNWSLKYCMYEFKGLRC